MKWKIYAAIGILAVLGIAFWQFNQPELLQPELAFGAAPTKLRQEVNITNAYYYAASGAYATSSEIVALTDTNYTAPSYYFEVIASTTAGTNASVSLVYASSSKIAVSVTIDGGNTYSRYRSAVFNPIGSSTIEYKVRLNNEAIGKGILSSRIVVLQSSATISNTETQIEIGANQSITGTATSTFTNPKYWYYDSAAWDASPTFYAEVVYKTTVGVASSTTYSTAATHTVILPGGTASTSVALRGGGGAGDGTNAGSAGGYGGGGGGAYSQSYLAATTSSHTLVIGAAAVGNQTTSKSPDGATTTWDGSTIVADGGKGAGDGVARGLGGLASLSTGITKFNGGDGSVGLGAGANTGAGGEGAGSAADGGDAALTVAGTGTDGGDGGAGRLAASEGDGNAGTAPGGAGGGANISDNTDHKGGDGALGNAVITSYIASSTIVLQQDDGLFANWTDVASTYLVNTATVGGG